MIEEILILQVKVTEGNISPLVCFVDVIGACPGLCFILSGFACLFSAVPCEFLGACPGLCFIACPFTCFGCCFLPGLCCLVSGAALGASPGLCFCVPSICTGLSLVASEMTVASAINDLVCPPILSVVGA